MTANNNLKYKLVLMILVVTLSDKGTSEGRYDPNAVEPLI